jgi:hypothetical protein
MPAPPPPSPATTPDPTPPAAQTGDTATATLTVTMLSRGKGVPEATRAAYNDIRALLEKQRSAYAVTDLRTQRIGLEGETRLCAEFRSTTDAQAALSDIRQRAEGVELLDISDAPCPSPKESKP